jgi:hypothetical protein
MTKTSSPESRSVLRIRRRPVEIDRLSRDLLGQLSVISLVAPEKTLRCRAVRTQYW